MFACPPCLTRLLKLWCVRENEIKGLEAALIAQVYNYATNVLGVSVLYDSHSYPYWFKDTNGNGVQDDGWRYFYDKLVGYLGTTGLGIPDRLTHMAGISK